MLCVFFTMNRSLYIAVDIRHNQCPCLFFDPKEIQALLSQNYDTNIHDLVIFQ